MKKLAKILSFILGPAVLWPAILIIFLFKTGLTQKQIAVFIPLLLLFLVFMPLGFIYFGFRMKKITDLDLTKRKERFVPLITTFICLLISFFFILSFGNRLLTNLFTLIIILLLVNGIITFFWKISFHVGLNTISTLLINYLFHWTLPILYLTIPLVFWSRLTLKKHTIAQLIGAFILNATVTIVFLNYVF